MILFCLQPFKGKELRNKESNLSGFGRGQMLKKTKSELIKNTAILYVLYTYLYDT